MAVRLRLRRMGRKKRPFYRIVAADQRAARDGRFIEIVGYYDPLQNPHQLELNEDRIHYWLENGAQPSTTVKSLLRRRGIWHRLEMQKRGLEPEKIEEEMKKWDLLQMERQKHQEAAKIEKAKKKAAKKEEEKEEKAAAETPAKTKAVTETVESPEGDADHVAETTEAEETSPETEQVEEAKSTENVEEEKADEKPAEPDEAVKKDESAAEQESVDQTSDETQSPDESESVVEEKSEADQEIDEKKPVDAEEKEESKKNVKKELDNISSDEKTDTAENAVEAESKDEK